MEAEKDYPIFLNLSVDGKTIVFQALRNYETSSSLFKGQDLLQSKSIQPCRPFAPERGEFCPKVKLLKHEVEFVMKNHPRAEKFVWFQNKDDANGSSFVCCNNYILHHTSLSSPKSRPCSLLTLLIIILNLTEFYRDILRVALETI
jgi:hypothetical protein